MNRDYTITYTPHRDKREVSYSNFGEVVKIAQCIANMPLVKSVMLTDGTYNFKFEKAVN